MRETLSSLLQWRMDASTAGGYTYLPASGVPRVSSFADLHRSALRVAQTLRELGVGPGDRTLLLYPAGLEFIVGFFGCIYAGAIGAPLPWMWSKTGLERVASVAADTDATVVLTTSAGAAEAGKWHTAGGQLKWLATDRLLAGDVQTEAIHSSRPGDIAYLQYTSGSTMAPRGVMITHENVISNLRHIDVDFRHTCDSVAVSWLPHHHDMGLVYGILAPLYGGFHSVVMSPGSFAQRPMRWLEALSSYRATHSGAPSFAYDLCAGCASRDGIAGLDLKQWQVAFAGAEPVRKEALERFAEMFAPAGFGASSFYAAYGLAEATLKVTGRQGPPTIRSARHATPGDIAIGGASHELASFVSVGAPSDATQVCIVDPVTCAPCRRDEIGEIWVCGPGVAQGYWRRTEETEAVFRAQVAGTDQPRYLRTGDLGFITDGELYVTGRLKDLIILHGQNLYPDDVESTAERAHPALKRGGVAAFAFEHTGGERLCIVAEVHRRFRGDFADVGAAVRSRVAEQYGVRAHCLCLIREGGLPRTTSGKKQRHGCRTAFLDGSFPVLWSSASEDQESIEICESDAELNLIRTGDAHEQRAAAERWACRLVAEVVRVSTDEVKPERRLTELGIDSMGAHALHAALLSKTGVSVPVEALLDGLCAADLANQALASISDGPAPTERKRATLQANDTSPASLDQERLYFLSRLASDDPAYRLAAAVRITGAVEVEQLERALSQIVRRHPELRAVVVEEGSRVVQRVHDTDVDFRAEQRRGTVAVPEEAARELCGQPFDLAQGPLVRFRLIQDGQDRSTLIIAAHHLIADAWTMVLLFQEIAEGYSARVRQGEARHSQAEPWRFAEYTRWQRKWLASPESNDDLEYWRLHLSNAAPPPWAAAQGAPSRHGRGRSEIEMDAALVPDIRNIAAREGCTVFVVLFTAFAVALSRWSEQTDFVVGVPALGRPSEDLQRTLGFLSAPLPIRVQLEGCRTFREAISRVRTTTLAAIAHSGTPLSEIARIARRDVPDSYRGPFSVMFNYLKPPALRAAVGDVRFELAGLEQGGCDVDFVLTVLDGDRGLQPSLLFDDSRFEAASMSAFGRSFVQVLSAAVRDPSIAVEGLGLEIAPIERAPAPAPKRRVCIAATFTPASVAEALDFWFHAMGEPADLMSIPQGQFFSWLLDPAGVLRTDHNDSNIILIRVSDLSPDEGSISDNLATLVSALNEASRQGAARWFVCVCPEPAQDGGSEEDRTWTAGMHERLRRELQTIRTVHVVECPAADKGSYDAVMDALAQAPYSPRYAASLATALARAWYAIHAPRYKAIAVDCDGTLWSGVCGEDGPSGVRIDGPHRSFQEFLVAQAESGVLLTVVSRNDEDDVWRVFSERPEMPLKREHIISARIGWGSKSDSLRSLAAELNLGLDSFVYLDDDPLECAEVRTGAREALVIHLPSEAGERLPMLQRIWAFDHRGSTAEDARRTSLYQQGAEREQLRAASATFQEFLKGLDLKISFEAVTPETLRRASELTYRTNQFNLTGRRRTEREMEMLVEGGVKQVMTVRARDRFGDYGIVGVLVFGPNGGALDVDTFLLSCRALGRGIEHSMLARLGKLALESDLPHVVLHFKPSGKNTPAKDFLDATVAKFTRGYDSATDYEAPSEYAALVRFAPQDRGSTIPPSQDDGAAVSPASVEASKRAEFLASLGEHWRTDDEVAHAVAAQRAARKTPGANPVRTATEQRVAGIWAEVLETSTPGAGDDFFELGGDSLLAMRVLARVREAFGVDVPVRLLFDSRMTVESLAKAIEQIEAECPGSGELPEVVLLRKP